ncbi:hypothetical protein JCM6882_001322 [Rhodosporidiobolus microsporus]
MLAPLAAVLALAGTAAAAPLAASVHTLAERAPIHGVPELDITYSSPANSSLPKTLILATGGTIAGSSASNTDSTTYQAGVVGIATLVQAVPELLNVSNIDGMQVSNVGSESLTDEIALRLSKITNEALCGANASYDAVVITHGTDTLEETAYFLDATVSCDAPVVITGAMRPSSAISADGPNNLLQAVTTAVTPDSKARGTLVVLNDRICQAYYCAKREANTLDTFAAPEQGYVGTLLSDKPFYYYPAVQPTFKEIYDITNVTELPPVEIFYGYQGADFHLLNASVASGAKAIVIAGTGAGSLTDAGIELITEVASSGIPIVRSTKINNGFVVPGDYSDAGVIAAGSLNPVKSRRLLQILLALGKNATEIQDAFEGKLSSYLNYNIAAGH